MAPRYKIDATKRVINEFRQSPVFSQPERFTFLLGMKSMARILVGEDAGVTRYMEQIIHQESMAAGGE